jgi:MFS family permease
VRAPDAEAAGERAAGGRAAGEAAFGEERAAADADAAAPPAGARRSALGAFRRAAVDVRPLRYPDYRRLWLGNGVSLIGFQLTAVAVPVEVYSITRSSFWVGVIGIVGLVPLIVFGLWGGAIADAVDRRKLLLVSSTLVWLCTVALFVQALFGMNSVPLLLVLVAVQAAGFAVSSPTRGAIIPRLIPTGLVPAANTLNFTASNVGLVAGPLLAGVVIAQWSFAAAYAIDAVLFGVALYATLRLPPLPPLGETSPPGLRSVIDGLEFIATRPVLLLSFAVDIVAMVFAMPRALFPEAADERFGGGDAVGWLFAAIAIGAVAGGLFSGWIGRVRRQGVALVAAIVAWGLAVAAAGLVSALWAAVALLAVAGAADLVSAVYRQTILQVYAPDEMRGRMQGVFIVVVAGGPRLGDLRAGATAGAAGMTVSWVGGGLACVLVVIVVAALFRSLVNYDASVSPGPSPRP